ncbi:MAG: hypothetical protein M3R35_01310, partial [Candidatus Eremiobacteraeota bacterium]|nr:hypothetical protein [Candidatus Eremiobacteraeota bacterium]
MPTASTTKRKATSGPHSRNEGPNAPGQRQLLAALKAFQKGDFSARLSVEGGGIAAEIATAFNDCIEVNARLSKELQRVSRLVGRDGRISQRASVGNLSGGWLEYVESCNTLIDDLTAPMAETNRVLGSVAQGDLSQRMALDIEDRPL